MNFPTLIVDISYWYPTAERSLSFPPSIIGFPVYQRPVSCERLKFIRHLVLSLTQGALYLLIEMAIEFSKQTMILILAEIPRDSWMHSVASIRLHVINPLERMKHIHTLMHIKALLP